MTPLILALAFSVARDSCSHPRLLPAYAHNDYRNPRPLLDALALGYRGVEADLFRVDSALLVGHDRKEARRHGSLTTLYLDPLRARLHACGYILADSTPFLVTIELKERDPEAFRLLVNRLRAYPELVDGPVRVTLVGWWPPRDRAPWPGYLGVQMVVDDRGRATGDTAGAPVALVTIDYSRTRSRVAFLAARALATRFAVPFRVHHAPADAHVYQWLRSEGVTLIGTMDLTRTSALLQAR